MSQKNDPVAQAMEGTASIIGKGLFAAFAGTTAFIAKKLQVPPEKQLRQLGTRPVWGEQIIGIPCLTCEELNEPDAEICFHCGEVMTNTVGLMNNTENDGEQITLDLIKSRALESINKIQEKPKSED